MSADPWLVRAGRGSYRLEVNGRVLYMTRRRRRSATGYEWAVVENNIEILVHPGTREEIVEIFDKQGPIVTAMRS